MKYLYKLIILFILTGCGNEKVENQIQHALVNNTISAKSDSWLYGTWVNSAYLENIQKLKSPYAVSLLSPYELITIHKENYKDDTLKFSWDNQFLSEFPGYNYYKTISQNTLQYIGYSYQDHSPNLNDHYADSIAPSHKLVLNNGFIQLIDNKNKTLKKYSYLTNNVQEEGYYVLANKVNELLIHGDYHDANNPGSIFSFLPGGKLKGFAGYDNYEINLLFWQDYGMYENDFIELRKADSRNEADEVSNKLIFKCNADTLLLYNILNTAKPEETFFKPTQGNLKLKLIKLQ